MQSIAAVALFILLAICSVAVQSAAQNDASKPEDGATELKLLTLLRQSSKNRENRKKRQYGYPYSSISTGFGFGNTATACGGQGALAGCINGACGAGLVCNGGYCCNNNLALSFTPIIGNSLYSSGLYGTSLYGSNVGYGCGVQLACVNFSCGQGYTCSGNCCTPSYSIYG